MKKVFLLSAVVAMAFTSCSKTEDFECVCSSSITTVLAGTPTVPSTSTTEAGETTTTQFEGVKESGAASDCPAVTTTVNMFEVRNGDFDTVTTLPIFVIATATTIKACELN